MYIPPVVIIIIIILIAFIFEKNKSEQEAKHNKAREAMQEERTKEWREHLKSRAEKEYNSRVRIIQATFDCSDETVQEILSILEKAKLTWEFDLAITNSERKNIYKNAIATIEDMERFHHYTETVLLPISEKENYNLSLETIEHYREKFSQFSDITDGEKLSQIYLNDVHHTNKTYECFKETLFDSFPDESLYKQDASYVRFTAEEILTIAHKFNICFEIGLSNSLIQSIDFGQFSYEYIGETKLFCKNADSLFSIFCACVFYSDFIPIPLRYKMNALMFQNILLDFFIYFPYYNIKLWKDVLRGHLKNSIIERCDACISQEANLHPFEREYNIELKYICEKYLYVESDREDEEAFVENEEDDDYFDFLFGDEDEDED